MQRSNLMWGGIGRKEPHTTPQPNYLENDASGTTPSGSCVSRAVHGVRPVPLSTTGRPDILLFLFKSETQPLTLALWKEGANLVVFPDLTNYRVESLVDVNGLLGGCFHEDTSEVFCQITTLCEPSSVHHHRSARLHLKYRQPGRRGKHRGGKPRVCPHRANRDQRLPDVQGLRARKRFKKKRINSPFMPT